MFANDCKQVGWIDPEHKSMRALREYTSLYELTWYQWIEFGKLNLN